jgi:4a-hydroxytetrahydrobiopterin dehydratase
MGRRFEICIDANDPDLLRPFWAEALGYHTARTEEGALDLADPAGIGPTVWFQKVPEEKAVKNRLHLDIWVDRDEVGPLRDELLGLGGTVLTEHDSFTVLGDPEGNELCICWEDEAPPTIA